MEAEPAMSSRIVVIIFGFLVFCTVNTQAKAQNFGAIAYSPSTGGHGYSFDYSTRHAAERRALRECGRRARGCRVAVWFKNGCGALATGSRGWGSGWGTSRNRAYREALRVCGRKSGRCAIRVYACTARQSYR